MNENENNTTSIDSEFADKDRYYKLQEMLEKAENTVAAAVAATAVTGAVPIPLADAPFLIAEQVAMMGTICGIFRIDIKKDGLKALAMAALGAGGATVVGKTIATSLLKFIPGVGTAAGCVISAGTAGVVTLAMGKAFIEVCKAVKMGKLREEDITSAKGKNMLKKEFRDSLKKSSSKDATETLPEGKQ